MHVITHAELEDYKADYNERKRLQIEFVKRVMAGEKLYVELVGSARAGTIGIVDFSDHAYYITEAQFEAARNGDDTIVDKYALKTIREDKDVKNYHDYIARYVYSYTGFKLRMDNGKIVNPSTFWAEKTFSWLVDYVGPTKDCFTKISKEAREAAVSKYEFKDLLGKSVKVGDFVALVIGTTLEVGSVSSLSKNGKSAYVKIKAGEKPTLITNSHKMVVMDDQTKTRAMVKKLAL